MKTMYVKYLALIAALLLISGCPNPFEPPVPEELQADEGFFSLYLGGINTGRTILPATVQNDFLLYTLEFFPAGTTSNPVNRTERNNSNISEPILLSSGTWDLYVIAYMDVAKTKPAAQGHLKDINIGSGETVRNSITLAAIIDEGEGVFKWNISYPTNVTNASMTITSLDSTNDTPKTTLYFIGGTPLTGNADSLALNAGYYRVVFNLSIGVLKTERRETLHIYKNMESSFEYTFIRNHFTYIIVTSGADSGAGSLRQAISDAPANSTIIIDNSVKTILLQNRLTINKNLVISGNSVIVTRDPTWTTVDYTTQLLYISGSTTTVTISHVHFKDGRTTDNGVAIFNNSSSLTLESCIFNGNRTPPTNSNAGAIYNNGTLNARGCTFYNNYTGGSNTGAGGAISTSTGTVTLEGNLFFGNSRPVVSNLYNSTIISRGYNMIDVPFGTGNNQSGWNAGTGDTTFSSLGINGVPLDVDTFIPVFNLRNYIPSVSEDFPLTDFYGDNRTFPGVPGAVASVNMNIVPVTEIIGMPASAIVGTPLTLIGTVSPSNATNQRITWSVSNAGTTGATITGDNVLNTTNAGTVIVTAAIANGTAPDVAYTQNFTINILFISVTEITGVPALTTAGTSMTLIGTVSPGNAINQTIMWTVKNQGTTGATIINGNTLVTTSMGTVVITATVSNGVSVGTNYIQDFTINSCSTDILVTSSADSGVGSLRHAMEYIFAGGTITIDNSVKTIVLNSRLTIDRSLIIEGNGVTLTRTSSSWAPDYLLYIGDEAETITISRVHFKDGYAYEYGVAIRSYSASLTLESCIFSGNRTSSNTAYGSAIWNYFGSLFIRGCTFYNNRANLIVNDVTRLLIVTYGTVVLEGNLFFGNGDPSHDSLLGGVSYPSSKGYNVVDVPFGRDVYQSGWNAGTGDTTFSSLGINSIPFDVDTFVPIYELRNYLPSVSEDFPLTDFYGNYRTYPGAPGAVGH